MYRYTKSINVTGKTWSELISNIQDELGFQVDSADKRKPNQFIMLYKYDSVYEAEVTQYSDGQYELNSDNINRI